MNSCVVCSSEFKNVGYFKITPSVRTGIHCKSKEGHPLCNICFARLYPQVCPVCKEDISGDKFKVPDELTYSNKAAYETYTKMTESIESYEMVTQNQSDLESLCVVQNALLLGQQLFGPVSLSFLTD